jgi:hypothetical protein
MSWASRRRGIYFGILILILIVFLGIPAYFAIHEAPTCFDNIQNGDEDGVDCGGVCEKVCGFQVADPIVKWSRFFEVAPGVYSVVAFIENPNFNVEAYNVPYSFKLRDKNNILIHEEKSSLYIPPKKTFPVFISGIRTESREPARIFFEFSQDPVWVVAPERDVNLEIPTRAFVAVESGTRLVATIRNYGLQPIGNIEVIALLYNEEGNVVGASKTEVPFLDGEDDTNLVFTWDENLSDATVKIDIFSLITP